MKEVQIYTDGACSGNPGPGGYGVVIMYKESSIEFSKREDSTTNNRMELMAAIKGLEALKEPCTVKLYSDSSYLVNAFEKDWLKSWKNKSWKTASGSAVKNIDLWQKLDELIQVHKVQFIKVKGHADNEYNNRCDKLATDAIKGKEVILTR